ncbi:MAG: GlcG protein [Robiginitomaculum sp.]|nr:MAG: GlcG protein [Robiginitomaculum sp.]
MLDLETALTLAKETLAEGRRQKFAPMTITVLDTGGHTIVVLRDDGGAISRCEIATAKAAGCLGMGFGGRELERRANMMPTFFNSLTEIFPKGMIALPGGVLLRDADGKLLGAAGVSGDTSDNDEIALLVGVKAAGLVAQTGA